MKLFCILLVLTLAIGGAFAEDTMRSENDGITVTLPNGGDCVITKEGPWRLPDGSDVDVQEPTPRSASAKSGVSKIVFAMLAVLIFAVKRALPRPHDSAPESHVDEPAPEPAQEIPYVYEGPKDIESLEVPDGVTEIGSDAFKGCRALKSLTLPPGLTAISPYAFFGCKSLISIKAPPGNSRYLFSDGVLYDKIDDCVLFCANWKDPNAICFVFKHLFVKHDVVDVLESLVESRSWWTWQISIGFTLANTADPLILGISIALREVADEEDDGDEVYEGRKTLGIVKISADDLLQLFETARAGQAGVGFRTARYDELLARLTQKFSTGTEKRAAIRRNVFAEDENLQP